MNTLITRCIRLTPAVWTAWYAIPLRFVVGYGFMEHGYAKIARGPEAFTNFLHALGVPAPSLLSWATILVELLGGLAVLLGAFIPLASIPMSVVLLVAIFSVHLPNGFSSAMTIDAESTLDRRGTQLLEEIEVPFRPGKGEGRSASLLPDFQGDSQFGHGARGGLEGDASLDARSQHLTGQIGLSSMALLRSLPENATFADLRRTYADLLEKLRPYGHRLMRGPSPLTPGERELIAAFVSGVNSCRYCHGAHSLVARAFGIDESVFAKSLDNIGDAPIDARLKPILRYVRKLTETPSRMTAADAVAVYEAGWSDEALLHAIAVCAYFNNMNRLVEGAGIVGSVEDYSTAAQRLVEHGYLRGGAERSTTRAGRRSSSKPPRRAAKRKR